MKKKYGLFKVLTVLLLLVVVASYFINGRDGSISYLAIGDVFVNYMQSFYYFFETALFILIVGGFYGLLNRIPAYKKLVRLVADKVSGKSSLFVIIMTIVFALIASFTGLNTILILFIPFVVSIILLLGYDKLVALSATVGGSLVGFIGGIFVTFKDAASQYETSYSTFDKLAGLDGNWSLVLPKVLLLIVGVGLLVFYIMNHIKKVENKEVSYALTKGDNFYVELKDRTGKKIKVDDTDVKVWPMIVGLVVFTILIILGYMPWNSLFGFDVFSKFHTWITGFTFDNGKFVILLLFVLLFIYFLVRMVKSVKRDGVNLKVCGTVIVLAILLWLISIFGVYTLEIASKSVYAKWISKLPLWKSSMFTTLISSNFTEFGNFGSLGTFMMAIVLMVLLSVILKAVYRVSFEDAMDGFIYGMKKMVPAAMITMLAYAVLVCSYNNGFIETIITSASKSFGDNAVINSLITMLGSVLNVDTYYTTAGVFSNIVSNLTDKANLKIYAIMFQSLYGLVQLVGPTSIMLIVGLTYLDVPYKTWLKYIWRLIVGLLIVIFITLMIVSLI